MASSLISAAFHITTGPPGPGVPLPLSPVLYHFFLYLALDPPVLQTRASTTLASHYGNFKKNARSVAYFLIADRNRNHSFSSSNLCEAFQDFPRIEVIKNIIKLELRIRARFTHRNGLLGACTAVPLVHNPKMIKRRQKSRLFYM